MGYIFIHSVVCEGAVEILNYILDFVPAEERCHLLNIQSRDGYTAVHDAVLNGSEKVIRVIL